LDSRKGATSCSNAAFVDGALEKFDACTRQFIERGVEVMVANSNSAIEAAYRATRSVPIVMVYGIAPVEAKFIASLAKPGGNITGNAFHTADTAAKQFDLMMEAFPRATRYVMLWNATRPGYHAYETVLSRVARERRLTLELVSVEARAEVPAALQRLESLRPDLLFVANDISFFPENKAIAAFALQRKWPSIGTVPTWVNDGGLLYFGPDELEALQGVPRYVARILQGAKPADLPVEQPSTYRLHFNAQTAQALGYAISPALKLRVDKVIG
jgi:putative ABC transport system substrate-binding protein